MNQQQYQNLLIIKNINTNDNYLFPLILIIISIIKMPNIIHNYKKYLELVAPEEQLREINLLIKEFNKSYLPCPNSNKKYIMINQISMLKKSC